MSTRFYDDALVAKFKAWTQSSDISVLAANNSTRLFEMLADRGNDSNIKLPIIAITRPFGYTIADTGRQPRGYSGATLDQTEYKSATLNAIKIELKYQIDVYARTFVEADELVRNLVFNIINFPSLTVQLPYHNMGIEHNASLILASEVEDNSDIPEHLIAGQFTRLTLNISIPDANLWDVNITDNKKIVGSIVDADCKDDFARNGIIIKEK